MLLLWSVHLRVYFINTQQRHRQRISIRCLTRRRICMRRFTRRRLTRRRICTQALISHRHHHEEEDNDPTS